MKFKAFNTFWTGCKSFWRESRMMTIVIISQIFLAIYYFSTSLPQEGQATDISRLALGYTLFSIALAEMAILYNFSVVSSSLDWENKKIELEKKKIDLDEKTRELILQKFDLQQQEIQGIDILLKELKVKLEKIENHIINEDTQGDAKGKNN